VSGSFRPVSAGAHALAGDLQRTLSEADPSTPVWVEVDGLEWPVDIEHADVTPSSVILHGDLNLNRDEMWEDLVRLVKQAAKGESALARAAQALVEKHDLAAWS